MHIYGQLFVIPTKLYQESIEKNLCKDISIYKTHKYYDIAKGKIKGYRQYKPKNNELSKLIRKTKELIGYRESRVINDNYFKKITKVIRHNIKQIKKQILNA